MRSCSVRSRAPPDCCFTSLKEALQQMDFRDAGLTENLTAVERGYNETEVYELKKVDHEAAVA